MGKLCKHIGVLEAESIVKGRYGMEGLRVFRLLNMKDPQEHTRLANLTLLPLASLRLLTYKMLNAGFLQMNEVPRTVDHTPSRTFFLWTVSLPVANQTCLLATCKAIRNMQLKLADILANHRHLLERAKELGAEDAAHALTPSEKLLLKKIENVQAHLEHSLLLLFDTLLRLSFLSSWQPPLPV